MNDFRESPESISRREAKVLIDGLDGVTNVEHRIAVAAFALACQRFEGAFEVWDENFEKMKEIILGRQRYRPPDPAEPPDFGSSPRHCWWCGGTR